MSTFDRKARMEQIERELNKYAEAKRAEDKDEMYEMWLLLGFGLYCISLGVILGRSF